MAAFLALLAACTTSTASTPPGRRVEPVGSAPSPSPTGGDLLLAQARSKIRHVIVIMQENRSFDSFFGTFPGADGIPMRDGVPTVCLPNPVTGRCNRPFHDRDLRNLGGGHDLWAARAHIDGGAMDGFVKSLMYRLGCIGKEPRRLECDRGAPQHPDVMGWHDAREIPNYWRYAQAFVLQDHMFEPNLGSSIPSHLAMVSGWSARCAHPNDVTTCRPNIVNPDNDEDFRVPGFAWTDLTYLLHANGVDWGWYIVPGAPPDCDRGAPNCTSERPPAWDLPGTPELWNVLPDFTTVHEDRQLGKVQTSDRFFAAARDGTLPAVSWVLPDWPRSDHPSSSLARGQTWVTSLVNAVMRGPDWESSAILLSWDDWGGFYDHVVPPKVDPQGYGLRVPGLLISPYAKRGFVDHQILSFDAYLKLIEDLFLGGHRIDPATDGRPDPRPNVREDAAILGDLLLEFDFSQRPLRLVLPVHPKPGPPSLPAGRD